MTTKDDIRRWLDDADRGKYSHMIVMVDTAHWTDSPHYVPIGEDPLEFLRNYQAEHGSSHKAVECYRLDLDFERQIELERARHWEMPERTKENNGVPTAEAADGSV